MLEEQLDRSCDTHIPMDSLLTIQKESIAQLQRWIECEVCATPKATTLVLALTLERLSMQLQKGVASYARRSRHDVQNDKWSSASANLGVLGGYQVDSHDEWIRIMGVLLLGKAKQLLSAKRALGRRRNAADSLLVETEMRLQKMVCDLSS